MTNGKAPAGAWVLLVLSTVVAAGTVLVSYGFLTEYGTTSGSAMEGAGDGLRSAAAPLALVGALVVAAFSFGRSSALLRSVSVAVLAFAVGGVLAAGARAAVVKYDHLDRVPDCVPEEALGGPAEPMLRDVQAAFSELTHPDRFSGGGSIGVNGCSTFLLNVTFEDAAAHYRRALPDAGWDVTVDEATRLEARRDGLVFVLADDRSESGMVAIAMEPGQPIALPPDRRADGLTG